MRLVDLVPRGLIFHGLILLAGLAVVALIEKFYARMPGLASLLRVDRVGALDLARPDSLGTWFAAMAMAVAAMVAGLIYKVRRFRVDDYQGQYRIWLWGVLCWLLLSADEIARSAICYVMRPCV